MLADLKVCRVNGERLEGARNRTRNSRLARNTFTKILGRLLFRKRTPGICKDIELHDDRDMRSSPTNEISKKNTCRPSIMGRIFSNKSQEPKIDKSQAKSKSGRRSVFEEDKRSSIESEDIPTHSERLNPLRGNFETILPAVEPRPFRRLTYFSMGQEPPDLSRFDEERQVAGTESREFPSG